MSIDTTQRTRYSGTKTLVAWPMTRGDYNKYRDWKTPSNEDPNDAGYLVEYENGGPANDSRHVGYISWSPAAVFERSYTTIDQPPQEPGPVTMADDQMTSKFIALQKFYRAARKYEEAYASDDATPRQIAAARDELRTVRDALYALYDRD